MEPEGPLFEGVLPDLLRQLYVGRRTAWAACVDAVPSAQPTDSTLVERCDVHGCTTGSASTYCDAAGAHFCETESIDHPPRELRCADGVADY